MNKALCIFLISTLMACSSARVITGPDGSPHQLITCGDIENCYKEATQVCKGKYKIINTSNEVSASAGVQQTANRLLVKCEKPTTY